MLPKAVPTVVVAVLAAMLLSTSTLADGNPKFLMAIGKDKSGVSALGTTTCIGGQLLGPMMCGPGTQRILLRDFRLAGGLEDVVGAGASFLQGTNQAVVHCNLDGNLQGICWGTFEMTIPGKGGKWEGSWNGVFDFVASIEQMQAIGHGSGGDLEGLQLKYDAVDPGGLGYLLFTARVTTR